MKRMANMPQLILAKDVDSKFRFITVAAQRAKQLQKGCTPKVETVSHKPARTAMKEVKEQKVEKIAREE